jgi:hypothetical protein
MDVAIADENAKRLAEGNVLPQLPNVTAADRKNSYQTILSQRITAAHLLNVAAALETVAATGVAKQIKQAIPTATTAQLNAALTAITT